MASVVFVVIHIATVRENKNIQSLYLP